VPYAPFESGSVEAEDRAVLQFHGNAAFKCGGKSISVGFWLHVASPDVPAQLSSPHMQAPAVPFPEQQLRMAVPSRRIACIASIDWYAELAKGTVGIIALREG
jgi:hypothetical protein